MQTTDPILVKSNQPKTPGIPGIPGTRWVVIALLLLMVIGGALRLCHLGELTLVADEGFQALAVDGVLQHGVPLLETGLIYSRAPLFTYTQALFANAYEGVTATTLRLPAAIAGILCIPVAFWFGRVLMDRRAGLILATLLTFSTWHIEMSRYARFYTVLQLLFMLGILCFYMGFYRHHWRYCVGFVLATIAAISFHDLGVMLGTLFLTVLPLRSVTWRRKGAYFLGFVATGIWWNQFPRIIRLCFNAYRTPFDWIRDTEQAEPRGLIAKTLSHLPDMTTPSMKYLAGLWDKPLVLAIMLMIPIAAALILLAVTWRRFKPAPSRIILSIRALLALGMIAAGLGHEMGMVVILVIVDLAFFVRSREDLLEPVFWVGCLGGLAASGLWGAWMLATGVAEDLSGMVYRLTRFPDIGRYYLQWLFAGWPVILVLSSIGWLMILPKALSQDTPDGDPRAWFMETALFLPVVTLGFLSWKFSEARYFFHLYPLMLMGYVWLIRALLEQVDQRMLNKPILIRSATYIACLMAVLFVGQDTNPVTAASIVNRTYTDTKNPYRSVLNWPAHASFHQDPQSTSAYVRKHMREGDKIICVGPPHIAALYRWELGRVDAQIGRRDNYVFLYRSKEGEPIYPVSGGQLIDSPEKLEQFLQTWSRQTVWLLADKAVLDANARFLDETYRNDVNERFGDPVFIGRDNSCYVAKLNGINQP